LTVAIDDIVNVVELGYEVVFVVANNDFFDFVDNDWNLNLDYSGNFDVVLVVLSSLAEIL
jgi:hypothetical protein